MDGGSDQNYPKEKEIKKTKWLSEQALQIAEKRRSKRQNRKGTQSRVLQNSKER